MPERSQVPQRKRGWVTSPAPLIVPRLYALFRDRRRVPSTRMLSWFRRNAGVLYGKWPIRPVVPPLPYWRVAPRSTVTAGGSGFVTVTYGWLPPGMLTFCPCRDLGSVKSLSLVRIRVPVPRTVRVPSPRKTPLYVVVPAGTRTTVSPVRVTSRPASTSAVASRGPAAEAGGAPSSRAAVARAAAAVTVRWAALGAGLVRGSGCARDRRRTGLPGNNRKLLSGFRPLRPVDLPVTHAYLFGVRNDRSCS